MVSLSWTILAFLARLGTADLIGSSPRYVAPRRQEPRTWTFTPREALGATDLVCLAGVVVLAVAFHRDQGHWPTEADAAGVLDVVNDVWSQFDPLADRPSDKAIGNLDRTLTRRGMTISDCVKSITSDERELRQRCLEAGFSEGQVDVLVARLLEHHANQELDQDISHFVGQWTDGVREFNVEPDGQVKWQRAARDVRNFKVSEPAKIDPDDDSLVFTLEFPRDRINPTGKAIWHLRPDMIRQTFTQRMTPHPDLEADGLSSKPLPVTTMQRR